MPGTRTVMTKLHSLVFCCNYEIENSYSLLRCLIIAMHAILLQLGVLPLTMCRLLIANLWNTPLGRYIPFNEMTKCHIAIGYSFMVLLFGTSIVFVMFFAVLCDNGEQMFCVKLRNEIMITGYIIFVVSVIYYIDTDLCIL